MKSIILTIFTLLFFLASFATIGHITGDTIVCEGGVNSLTDTTTGGTWSSNNTVIANIDSVSGFFTGVSAGTTTITYTVSTSYVTVTITVNPMPAPVTGTTSFCESAGTTLYNTTPGGGYWEIEDGSIELNTYTLNSATIIAFGDGPGNIIFTDTTGCSTTISVFAYPPPNPITGITSTYVDSTTTLNDISLGVTIQVKDS